jgi:hypothetical protein
VGSPTEVRSRRPRGLARRGTRRCRVTLVNVDEAAHGGMGAADADRSHGSHPPRVGSGVGASRGDRPSTADRSRFRRGMCTPRHRARPYAPRNRAIVGPGGRHGRGS